MRFAVYMLAGVLLVLLIAGCGGTSDSTPAPTDPPADDAGETTEPTPTVAADLFSLPDTPISATLTSTYKVPDPQGSGPSAAELPVAAGSVEARWYQSGGQYVVHYAGLSLDETGPICPGNSIATDSGFLHISNAPTGPGACTGVLGLATAPAGVKLCGAEVLYLTEIPVDVEGTLYGTIERYLADGTIIGLTSMAEPRLALAPEIDLSSCSSPQG